MRLLVICSLMTLGFSTLAKIKGPPKAVATKAVIKKLCGTLKPQASIEQTPTTACFVSIEGMEATEYLALYEAFDGTVYDVNDDGAKFSTQDSVTMPAHSVGKIYGVQGPKELRGRFIKTRGGKSADVTMNYTDKALKSVVVKIGNDIYEYENLTLQ